jgi:RND family efflux transporter MFP subunit
MIFTKSTLLPAGGLFALSWMLSGCDSTPPVAETPPPPVTVSQPLAREVRDYDDYEGRIAAVDTVEVRARVRGHLEKVNFQDGQLVKEKELLFEIDPRPYQATLAGAEAQKAAADAALELAKKEYARSYSLARSGAASREEVDVWTAKQLTAKADRQKALAAIEQAQLDLDFTKVMSPINGRISRTQVSKGNLINAGGGETLLTTIVTIDPIYVYFDVDERSLLRYRQEFDKNRNRPASIKELKIPIDVALEGDSTFSHHGFIDFADNKVNPSTGTIQVRGVLPNPKGLLDSGMRARVRVPVSDPHKMLLVTERAIGTDQGRKFFYVVNKDNVVERRDVKLGRVTDGLQIVQAGLKPDDWVIVNGIQRVRDGAKVEPKQVPMPETPGPQTKEQKS